MHTMTLLISIFTMDLLLAIFVFFFVQMQKNCFEFFYWGLSNLSLCIMLLLFGLRGIIPDFFSIVIANVLISITAALRINSLRLFLGKTVLNYLYPILSIPAFIFMMYFTYSINNAALRNLTGAIVISATSLYLAYLILKNIDKQSKHLYIFFAFLCFFYAIIAQIRAFFWVTQTSFSLFSDNLNNSTYFFFQILVEPLYIITLFMIYSHKLIYSVKINNDELKKNECKVHETNEYLENLINYANAPIIVWDIDYKITRFNHAFESLTGLLSSDVVGNHISLLFPEDSKKETLELIKQTVTGERWETVEIPILHISDEIKYVLWNSANIYDASKKILLSTIAQGADITLQKKQEEKNKKMHYELIYSDKMASVGMLAAGVAHEINNPLAIIKGNLSILEDKIIKKSLCDETEKVFSILEKQSNAVERIALIVNNLRNYARTKNDGTETIDIHKATSEVLSLCEIIYKKSNITIQTQFNINIPLVVANTGKIQQVIMNILNNARDAIEEKGNEGLINISTELQDRTVVLKIEDNGIGMNENIKNKIFEPFFTTKPENKGTGLGLSISQAIMHSYGGKITFENNKTNGMTCSLYFPISQENISIKKQVETTKFISLIGKVLVVDDEEDLRNILREYCEKLGLTVTEACDGLDALNKIKENDFDVIISDIKMPKLRGDQLVAELKKQNINKAKILIITGGVSYDLSGEQLDIIKNNTHGLINKPFTMEEVYKVLSVLLSPK